MGNEPLISVIIPSYNCASTLGVALESILNQTYTHTEIIVVDDASTDTTMEVVRAYQKRDARIRYIHLSEYDRARTNAKGRNINAGWAARNHGFTESRGEWIVYQDADDGSLRNRIEVMLAYAKKYTAVHVTVDWLPFEAKLTRMVLDTESALRDHPEALIQEPELSSRAQRSRGIIPALIGPLHQHIPFSVKQMRGMYRLFFGTLESYPGTGHPLVHHSVLEKISWRPRDERVWPSFVGRGADRDFNFRVANTFKKSISIELPLYLWRASTQNLEAEKYRAYIHN